MSAMAAFSKSMTAMSRSKRQEPMVTHSARSGSSSFAWRSRQPAQSQLSGSGGVTYFSHSSMSGTLGFPGRTMAPMPSQTHSTPQPSMPPRVAGLRAMFSGSQSGLRFTISLVKGIHSGVLPS